MNYIFTIRGATSNQFYRVGSNSRADKYPFARVPGRTDQHQLVMTAEEFEREKKDFPLRLQTSPYPIDLRVELTDEDRQGGDVIEDLRTKLRDEASAHEIEMGKLRNALEEAHKEAATAREAAGGMTKEQTEGLQEHGLLLGQLLPYVKDQENDTPNGVLASILSEYNTMKNDPNRPAEPEEKPTRTVGGDEDAPVIVEGAPEPDEPEPTVGGDEQKPEQPSLPQGSGFEPEDARYAHATGDRNPGDPVSVGGDGDLPNPADAQPPVDLEWNEPEFRETLKHKDAPELKGLAAPLGIIGFDQMNKKTLIKRIVEAEKARNATKEVAPHNTARPDGETGEETKEEELHEDGVATEEEQAEAETDTPDRI